MLGNGHLDGFFFEQDFAFCVQLRAPLSTPVSGDLGITALGSRGIVAPGASCDARIIYEYQEPEWDGWDGRLWNDCVKSG